MLMNCNSFTCDYLHLMLLWYQRACCNGNDQDGGRHYLEAKDILMGKTKALGIRWDERDVIY